VEQHGQSPLVDPIVMQGEPYSRNKHTSPYLDGKLREAAPSSNRPLATTLSFCDFFPCFGGGIHQDVLVAFSFPIGAGPVFRQGVFGTDSA